MAEANATFCWNGHRRKLWNGLLAFINAEYRPIGIAAALLIDGSFVRSEETPSDIDMIIDISHIDTDSAWRLFLKLRLRHDALKAQYGVDVWLRHPTFPVDLAEYFQYLGDKAAVKLGMDPRTPKGIVRVQP